MIRRFISRPMFQPMFGRALKLCHAGMNCGGGQNVKDSGEAFALKYLRKTQPASEFTLFDVGANEGAYLHLATSLLPGIRAWAFEPNPEIFRSLTMRFGSDRRVRLHQMAMGSEVGTGELHLNGTNSSLLAGDGKAQAVSVSTVDTICEQEGIRTIDLLKIDTEGFEMAVLQGACRMIGRDSVGAIQFEFGDAQLNSRWHFIDFWNLLSPQYRIYRVLRKGLWPIKKYSPDLEIYKTTNFLCVL